MTIDLNSILGQIGRDKGIERTILIEAVESAMLSAARKHYGHHLNLEAKYDPDVGDIEVYHIKTIVDKVLDPETQISLNQARSEVGPDVVFSIGDDYILRLETKSLGRIAAQTAKQVIIQKMRDAERGVIFEEFKNSKGDLINGIVSRYEKGNVIVNLGRTEAILPKREQIIKEKYRQGDRIRSMILDIDKTSRGPQIVLTRSHPEFLRKLFEHEVVEIQEKVIEIKGVAREPGERAKIAVHSRDASLDPVGACVGIKGSRVQAVVGELKGEKVDIITWTSDEPSYVARALAPAEVTRVVVDEDNHAMEVVVNDDQLSLAIGKRGQNVKLASKLTGWKIDVRSVSAAEEESKKIRKALEAIPDIDFTNAEMLYQAGYRSIKEVVDADKEELLSIQGFDEAFVTLLKDNALRILETQPEIEVQQEYIDIDKIIFDEDLRNSLVRAGFSSIQSVMVADDDDLLKVDNVGEEELKLIKDSAERYLRPAKYAAKVRKGKQER
jgi:transcription termination/antitermination protein NusA